MSGMIAALSAPLVQLLHAVGTGTLPIDSPATVLRRTSDAVETIRDKGHTGRGQLDAAWSGKAAEAALSKHDAVQKAAAEISDRGLDIAKALDAASADVRTAVLRLETVLRSFLTQAEALEPVLLTPPGFIAIFGLAQEHLSQALVVVAQLRTALDGHTGTMTALAPPHDQVPAPVAPPAGTSASSAGTTAAAASTGAPPMNLDTVAGGMQTAASSAGQLFQPVMGMMHGGGNSGHTDSGLYQNGQGSPGERALNGQGVLVHLPDGSTALAPNEKAAKAVQAALTQRGVPYCWGGTTPGQGLDCSGLTKYAYGQAGVELPRLAQEQGNGHARVDVSDVMPGDLAVWDGHVAMVIGNGKLIEAGDPVEISSIRMENEGMAFHGFYRPTE